jgi:hypothetical protein
MEAAWVVAAMVGKKLAAAEWGGRRLMRDE